MRAVAWIAVVAVVCAAPAQADDGRLDWPLRPRPAVLRVFDAPSPNWQRGHRGVDLAGVPGQPVYAAGPGTVVFAGELAGRPVVSIAHPGGLRTSYEPVVPSVRPGQLVAAGAALGEAGCRSSRLRRRRPACTGVRCGVRRRTPTTSIRSGCWPPRRSGSSRCMVIRPRADASCVSRCVGVQSSQYRDHAKSLRCFGGQARGWAWSCTARSRATVTWV